jgi:hypothetical protein
MCLGIQMKKNKVLSVLEQLLRMIYGEEFDLFKNLALFFIISIKIYLNL